MKKTILVAACLTAVCSVAGASPQDTTYQGKPIVNYSQSEFEGDYYHGKLLYDFGYVNEPSAEAQKGSTYHPTPYNGSCGFASTDGFPDNMVRVRSFSIGGVGTGSGACPSDNDLANIGYHYVIQSKDDRQMTASQCGIIFAANGTRQYKKLMQYYRPLEQNTLLYKFNTDVYDVITIEPKNGVYHGNGITYSNDWDFTGFVVTPTTKSMAKELGFEAGVCPTAQQVNRKFGNGIPKDIALGEKSEASTTVGEYYYEPYTGKEVPFLDKVISAEQLQTLKDRISDYLSRIRN